MLILCISFCVYINVYVYVYLVVFVFFFSFVASPSVLWYCWLGLFTCKNRLPYNLYCVGGDVKQCSLTHSLTHSLLDLLIELNGKMNILFEVLHYESFSELISLWIIIISHVLLPSCVKCGIKALQQSCTDWFVDCNRFVYVSLAS